MIHLQGEGVTAMGVFQIALPSEGIDVAGWAAVAQALLSAAAILFAWTLQNRQHRIEALQRSAAIVELLRQTADVARAAAGFARAHMGGAGFAELDSSLLSTLRASLEAVPAHEMPIAGLVAPVIEARRTAQLVDEQVLSLRKKAQNLSPVTEQEVSNFAENSRRISEAYETAVVAHVDFAGGRWGLKAFGRDLLNRIAHTVIQ